ncbi:hypothetical protein I4641_19315 [Waterburya agarophytonicola K14]|uniref:LapA family protein n=1 Tax=Waterburya agarophytonicola KI4 TaxID=2874699 RepID=A0A964BXG7_9CYAN|nr:hypothetical protein [Waterburya agarophytonicola]MCC0179120.1 hypothetical protein [Waterburya agarophytonicola KI4]
MSRLKLVLLALIVAILGIVLVQNREPIALKLLCPDTNQSCLYQTPALPLAVWMGVFAIAGLVSSLLGQVLNRYRYSGAGRQKSNPNPNHNDFDRDRNQWSPINDKSDKYTTSTSRIEDSTIEDKYSSSSYEIPQTPESIERSGSNYSYKYRDAKDKSDTAPSLRNSSSESTNNSSKKSIDSDINLNKDDEDWI